MIVIIKHIGIEGPGTIGEFFKEKNLAVRTIELDRAQQLPESISDINAIIVLGGPMNVYEEKRHSFLKHEDAFLKKAMKERIPILGICLGAQLLAKVCGAKVTRAKQKEIGWYKVELTKDGTKDRLFSGLGHKLDIFQWHEDTFEIPKGAQLLTTSNTCRNQAFRLGENAYGLQFHIEVTGKMIESWIREYRENSDIQSRLKDKQMLIDYYGLKERFNRQANEIYLNFSKIIWKDRISV